MAAGNPRPDHHSFSVFFEQGFELQKTKEFVRKSKQERNRFEPQNSHGSLTSISPRMGSDSSLWLVLPSLPSLCLLPRAISNTRRPTGRALGRLQRPQRWEELWEASTAVGGNQGASRAVTRAVGGSSGRNDDQSSGRERRE